MKNHKEFFQYVIPSMLAFALSGVYSIADGFTEYGRLGNSYGCHDRRFPHQYRPGLSHGMAFSHGYDGRRHCHRHRPGVISPFGLTFAPNITLILVNKSASIFGGAMAVTCYAPVSYICCVVQLLLQGVSDGCQPLLSLSYGQGKEEKTQQLRNLAYRFSFLCSWQDTCSSVCPE